MSYLALSQDAFSKVIVQSTKRISPTSSILRLVPTPEFTAFSPLPCSYSLSISSDNNEQRPYTPINPIEDPSMPVPYLDLLVRQYPNGIVSTFLSTRRPLDAVSVRGPFIKLGVADFCLFRELGMISGGTGIAPMLQIIRYCLNNCPEMQIKFLFGNVSPEEVLLKKELDQLEKESGGRLSITYAVDSSSEATNSEYLVGMISKEMIQEVIGPERPGLKVLLCGPPGMMKAIGGGGRKEPLGGALLELNYSNVHKY